MRCEPDREVLRTGGGAEELAGYSRAVRTGSWISVSGTAPAGRGDVHDQTLEAFRIALAAGSDWRGAAAAHRELFGEVTPANTTLFVAGFIPEGVLVEVEVDAVV